MPDARNKFDTGYLKQKTFKILDILHLWIQSDLPFKKKKETKKLFPFIASLNLKQLLH